MKIEKDKWVEIHYTLKNDEGQQLDSSVGSEPLGYVHGRGYLIAGLEKLLMAMSRATNFLLILSRRMATANMMNVLLLSSTAISLNSTEKSLWECLSR